MTHYIYLAPEVEPAYWIKGSYYNVTSLQPSSYDRWSEEALFGIPINFNRKWTATPVLVVTTSGGVVVETNAEGRLAVGRPSSKCTMSSPILQLYRIKIPDLKAETLQARSLTYPNLIGWSILNGLAKYRLSFNEYLGRTPVQEGGDKISFETAAKMWDSRDIRSISKIPTFTRSKRYEECNVIIVVTDQARKRKGTIGKLDIIDGKYQAPSSTTLSCI